MLYVLDTHAVIWNFPRAFRQIDGNSDSVKEILSDTLFNANSEYRLVVPSIVFVEIFDKFSKNREDANRVFYECFTPLRDCERVEIRELDFEVLETLSRIRGVLDSHEINDKIVVATGIVLSAPIVTKDPIIQEFAREERICTTHW